MRLLMLISAMISASAQAGPHYSLDEKVFTAAAIAEVTYAPPFADRSSKPTATVKVLFGALPPLFRIPHFAQLAGGPKCSGRRRHLKSLRALVFVDKNGVAVLGVEQYFGAYSSLNPDYRALKEATIEARSWPEERMRTVAPQMLFRLQKSLLERPGSPVYLRYLAHAFLRRRDNLLQLEKQPVLPSETICR
jgi:hypothetical protein